MLNYQTTSYHNSWYAREVLGLKPAPEFEAWFQRNDFLDVLGRLSTRADQLPLIKPLLDKL